MSAGEEFIVLWRDGTTYHIHKTLTGREEALRSAERLAKEMSHEVQVFRRIATASVSVSVDVKLG